MLFHLVCLAGFYDDRIVPLRVCQRQTRRERATPPLAHKIGHEQGRVEESPSGQGYHWNGNAETYFLIGDAMAKALLEVVR